MKRVPLLWLAAAIMSLPAVAVAGAKKIGTSSATLCRIGVCEASNSCREVRESPCRPGQSSLACFVGKGHRSCRKIAQTHPGFPIDGETRRKILLNQRPPGENRVVLT
ncbi:MAG: hypothetical protein KatS3mg105_1777 [Gemmatales bacterium]|nr:MAG: hypothetical protein KatS3mg105_1777 [Gemmatales bacterium]